MPSQGTELCAVVEMMYSLEVLATGRGPRQHVPQGVGDGDDRVVERRVDMRDPERDVLLFPLLAALLPLARSCHFTCLGFPRSKAAAERLALLSDRSLLARNSPTAALLGPGVRVRPLSASREVSTVPHSPVRANVIETKMHQSRFSSRLSY